MSGEKEKKISFNKKILIAVLAVIAVLVAIICAVATKSNVFNLSGKENLNANAGVVNGDKGYISSAQIIQTKTGTGPWDADDEPGNDSSEDNNIVRSFDQVTWTVDLTMALKEGVAESSLAGGIINVEASLPENCANVMKWDLDSMNWLENGNVSTDGRTLTGQYSMSENDQTIPGKQTLVFVLSVNNASNGMEISPSFKFYLSGNDDEDKIEISSGIVVTSAAPSYNVQLKRNTAINKKGYFDFETKDEVEQKTSSSIYGRMQGYGITIQLYNQNPDKELKGIELPSGDITFDLTFNELIGTEDVTNQENYMPVLWDYKENMNTNTGKNGNNMNWNDSTAIRMARAAAPYNSGGATADDACYDGGNWNAIQDSNSENVYHITISGYNFDLENFKFPVKNCDASSTSAEVYGKNIGCFSAGYFQVIMQMPEEVGAAESINMKVNVSNLEMTSVSNIRVTEDKNSSDNSLNDSITLYPPGSYYKGNFLHSRTATSSTINESGSTNLSPTATGGESYVFEGDDIVIVGMIGISSSNDDNIKAINILQKFDDEAFEPIEGSKNDSGMQKITLASNSTQGTLNVLYAAKPDRTGWENDLEMQNTREENLIYFQSIDELKSEGYTCVGVLFENRDITGYPGSLYYYGIKLSVKDSAKLNTVYQTVNDAKIWKDNIDFSWSEQQYTYDITNGLEYIDANQPQATWEMYNGKNSSHPIYIKSEYDTNGELKVGTHNGYRSGQSVLITGSNLHGSINTIYDNDTQKVNYDLGKNENTVKYSVEPKVDANSNLSNQISDITLKAEVTLPQGLTYKLGSSEYGDPDIIDNEDGTQQLTWYIYGCTSGQAIEPITFEANIDNESANGQQYTATFIVSEVVGQDGISKIGNSEISNRTSTETISIINLATHRLYKEVETPVIEKNGQIKYRVVYENKTEETVPEFQLLDILPYNGDSRGSNFAGTYTLNNVNVTQTVNGASQATSNLKLYTTNSEEVRNITAKDDGIGTDSIWTEKAIGSTLNENATGLAIKGELQGKAKVELEITLNTSGNAAENIYKNDAMAQVYADSEQMQTGIVEAQVVNRRIEGKVWEDANKNGIIDNNEAGMAGITVKLTNTTTSQEVGSTTTNEQGEYNFTGLDRAKYKVQVEYGDTYYLTEKEVGDNIEINSKFNTTTSETDEITKLDSILSPEIVEENVNAGLIKITYNITTKVEGVGGNISGEGEAVYETVGKEETNTKDIVVSPNEGYRVDTIKVNGSPIAFTEEANHSVILSKFTNMQENKEVVVTFKKIETSVLVHHYKENTTEQLSKDVTINGEVGDDYTTQVATDIPQNYELVATPAYASGKMTEEQIVVTYYYRLKTPNITNQIINKTGTDRITVTNQEMSYTITYRAEIIDYIGNAEVTIVDTLPYAIDEGKSDLAGGTYSSADRTITWTENVSDIDSYNEKGTVNVTKTFKVVYVGLDMNQEKITNNVKGNIKLLTPEKTSEEVTGNQESTIYKAIISAEKLVDKPEAIEGEKVTYTIRIKNEGNLAKTVTVRDTLQSGITFDNDTLIQVGETGTVYTEQNLKNGIPVEVPAEGSIDVVFAGKVDELASNQYSKEIKNQATVDNEPTNEVTTNITKVNITAHKESEPASGNKVREGDEITYRIRVRNDGTRAGDVIVKDAIPTGTTFVEGSIKIDSVADSSKTATDLQNGMTLNVPISEEKVVEFKVRVNKQIDGTKIKNTAYINQNGEDEKVPEEPEHTYVEPKEEQSITKNGTTTIESLDQEITYNINYTAHITDYSGRATVKLVDTLPYAIDTNLTNIAEDLDGGTYDEASKTITWEEAVENIQLTEEKEVTINKTIKVVYKDVSQDTVSIKNIVTGHIEYETPVMTSDEVTANLTTTTGFTVNIPVSKVWEDDSNKLGQRPTKVVFKLHGSDGSEYTKEMSKPGTAGSTTTQDSLNPNKWNDIFGNLPKYDSNNQEIVYTLTEEEKTEGELKYYDNVVTDKTITNTNKYGKVTVHYYIMNTDGSTTTTRVPNDKGQEIQDVLIEGKEGAPYTTEEAKNINEKYELVAERLPANATGTIEKYNEEKAQEVIYYYRLKPAKVIINYLEKDEDTEDSNNQVLTEQEQIEGHVDDVYNTDTEHRKETIEKDGKTYTLVEDSGNKEGIMTLTDTTVTYYYLQNTKATVRYVERDPETGEIVKDLEKPTVKEGLVGDEFVTNSKDFIGYKLVESPEKTTINLTKEEQTLIYYYEAVYTGLIENHIDDKTGKILETETHEIQVGEDYNIPSKKFEGYDLVESKLPENAEGTMGEELVTVNYYYIKKAVLEVNYVNVLTNEPLTEQVVDETKHEGDNYITEEKAFENYDMIRVEGNKEGTLTVETDEEGNITNNRTIVTYYYAKKSAGVEEHHIDILTGKDIEEPTLHEGHVGDEYDIKAKEFLSYKLIEADEEGNSMLPTNATGTMTEEKIVVNYYYNQPAKVIVYYVEKATGKELEETNPETGELQNSQIIIEGQKEDEYTTQEKEFEYYTLIEKPQEEQGQMKVEITKDEEGNDVVNNTIELYYYYEAKPFNIGVEKEITGIAVNGERRAPSDGKLEKVEIYRKAAEDTSVQIEYKIKVINSGEVSGNATIEENIPEGMKIANNDGTWEEQEGKLIKVIPEIGAGETKEYTVLLNWEQTGENMGEKANEIKLVETGNVPGFVDNNDKDNTANANVIISVETGAPLPIGLIIVLVAMVGLETITLRYAVVLTKKQKKVNKK